MTLSSFLIIAATGYLLGSLSFAIIVSKIAMGKDIRVYGSGNAGLTNAYRVMGGKLTLLVLAGDILKAVVAIQIGAHFAGPLGKLIAGIFVIVGHVFPVYFGFKGGKGVLVGAVTIVMFDWRIFAIVFLLFLIVVAITKWVSLGSIIAAAVFPVTMHLFHHDLLFDLLAAGTAIAVIYMHRANIGRILKGTENKFSFGSKKSDDEKKPDVVPQEKEAPSSGMQNTRRENIADERNDKGENAGKIESTAEDTAHSADALEQDSK